MDGLERAIKAFRSCTPVLIYDSSSREDEVDYVLHASCIDAERVYEMRTIAGGLICFAMPIGVGRALGIDLAKNIVVPELRSLAKRPRYGDEPAFSIWVNHVDVRTGIRDSDRALTISRLYTVVETFFTKGAEQAREMFWREFYIPGHVPILLGRSIRVRKGHTELSLYLAVLANMIPATVLVEMLDRGNALSLDKARRISEEFGYPIITCEDIVAEVEKLDEDLHRRYHLLEG